MWKCALCEDCGWVCESHPDRPAVFEPAHYAGVAGASRPVALLDRSLSKQNHWAPKADQSNVPWITIQHDKDLMALVILVVS
jgi:hypothetical protein